ncbi:MAG: triose-phosphate isomerase [Dehalococcoidales bacterium]|nr:triose-phosphate isomerase [Dehalococcoidales bacterium]
MRIPLIAGNWKMNTNLPEAVRLVMQMVPELIKVDNVETLLCPPYISLATTKDLIKSTPIKLGAQNLFYMDKGAYTGEISPVMLSNLCEYVIIGHSERRQYFQETGEITNKKIKASLKAGLKPILCVGEKLKERDAGKTDGIISEQLTAGLEGINTADGIVIAYEPVWAIGTGEAATGEQANDTIGHIRQMLSKQYGSQIAGTIRILYGGSVTPDNATEFFKQTEIDGGLVGGASLKADQFISIVKQAAQIKK